MQLSYKEAKVLDNIKVTDGIYKMTLEGDYSAAKPGQFYMLKGWKREPLLGRPISIYDVNEGSISFLYQVRGKGTQLLSEIEKGGSVELWGPLGNSFEIDDSKKRIAVVGGGIGVAPLLYLVKSFKNKEIDFYAGFRNDVYAVDEINNYVNNMYVSTEDGSQGHKGYVIEMLKPENYDCVLCCGPEIMMKKVIDMCQEKNVPVLVSMEKHMACGVGACLVCTCKTNQGNKRVCKDGPIFNGEDVVIDA